MAGKYPIAVLPFSKFEPAACHALVAAIDDALETFAKWNLPTGPNTKLQKARALLTRVAETGSYGTTTDEFIETTKAIVLANDFYAISRTLTDEPKDIIAEELREALRGSLTESAVNHKKEFNLQSQFWLGAVLAHAGLHPAVPESKNRRPDFVISVGTLQCGVEVKRPRSRVAIKRNVVEAATQLYEYGKPGVIVLDLTRCIAADDLILHQGPPTARDIAKSRFDLLANELMDGIHGYSRSESFGRVILLVLFVRFSNWTPDGLRDFDFGFFFKSNPIDGYSGLLADQSDRIQTLMERGFERISGNPLSVKRTWN